MRKSRYLSLTLLALASSTAVALPPNAAPGLVPGANHHTGDTGFVATYGRQPHAGEEKARMHEHFVAVRARLAAGHAPTPALEAKRQQLLGFLDQYIAKGTTPDNSHLPWRTPVFIDDEHTICAVGFLIEQSAGRPMAEKIAKTHRYSFIEDIAKDMPDVRDWVAQSGFTLDELGQIQPGYMGPDVLQFRTWNLAKDDERLEKAKGGDYDSSALDKETGKYESDTVSGTVKKHRMEGDWKVMTVAGPDGDGVAQPATELGEGSFKRGAGTWSAFYDDGKLMAKGEYAKNLPNGAWKMYFEDGNLAAEGAMAGGQRAGKWSFYYDTAAKTPIAIGSFGAGGYVRGTWKHFDQKGVLLATSVVDTPSQWEKRGKNQLFWSIGYLLDIAPGADKIHHRIHQGSLDGQQVRMDELVTGDGKERVFMVGETVFDTGGHELVAVDGGWLASDCGWTKAQKRAAAAGDIAQLHGSMIGYDSDSREDDASAPSTCKKVGFVDDARAQRITSLVDSMQIVRQATPELITKVALGDTEAEKTVEDLPNTLAASMQLDIEWPHVDGRFSLLYRELPGYSR